MRSPCLIVFLIFLIVSPTFCTKTQDVQFLDSIKNKEFGKTILQSLQLELRTGSKDAVSNILTLLNRLKQDNEAQQSASDADWSAESAQCSSTKTTLENDIKENNDKIAENDQTLFENGKALKTEEANLKLNEEGLKALEDNLALRRANRKTEHENYEKNVVEISSTIAALHEGKRIISALTTNVQGGAFFQKPNINSFVEFTNTFKNLKIEGKYKGFINAFISMMDKDIIADPQLVQKVIDLIDDLLKELSRQLADLTVDDQKAQDDFEREETRLLSDIGLINGSITENHSIINSLNTQIASLNSDNEHRKTVVDNKTVQLRDETKRCNDDEKAYNEAKTQRANELDIIKQVITIFETRFENVRSYLTENSFF